MKILKQTHFKKLQRTTTPDEALAETISWQLCYALLVIMLIAHDAFGDRDNNTQRSMALNSFSIGQFLHTRKISDQTTTVLLEILHQIKFDKSHNKERRLQNVTIFANYKVICIRYVSNQ